MTEDEERANIRLDFIAQNYRPNNEAAFLVAFISVFANPRYFVTAEKFIQGVEDHLGRRGIRIRDEKLLNSKARLWYEFHV